MTISVHHTELSETGQEKKSNDCETFKNELKRNDQSTGAGRPIQTGILRSGQLYNEMTYSDLFREWTCWLHSSGPIYQGYRGEICYLRGNVSYAYDKETGVRKQSDKFQNRAKDKEDSGIFRGDTVFQDTPIFIPILSATYSVGEKYSDGTNLDTIAQCQFVCRRDIDGGGPFWCTIEKKDCSPFDLIEYVVRVDSPSFQMTVAEDSPLRGSFEMPIEPGTYQTASYGLVLLLRGLGQEGEYRLRFGGYGRGKYKSDSVWDFIVSGEGRRPSRDPTPRSLPPAIDKKELPAL